MTDSWRRCSSHSNLPGNKLPSQGHLCFGLASRLQPSGLRSGQVALGSPPYIEKDPIFRYKELLQFHWHQIRKCLPLWMSIFMRLNLVSWTFKDTLMKCVCAPFKEKACGSCPIVKILARRQLINLSSHMYGFFSSKEYWHPLPRSLIWTQQKAHPSSQLLLNLNSGSIKYELLTGWDWSVTRALRIYCLFLKNKKNTNQKPYMQKKKQTTPYSRKTHHQKNPTGYFYKLLKK